MELLTPTHPPHTYSQPPPSPRFPTTHTHTHPYRAGALLMAPGLRLGRVLCQLLQPPQWARRLPPAQVGTVDARLGFALMLLALPLWVRSRAAALCALPVCCTQEALRPAWHRPVTHTAAAPALCCRVVLLLRR